jgi:hypothetical protein
LIFTNATSLLDQGRTTFRHYALGSESFWGGALNCLPTGTDLSRTWKCMGKEHSGIRVSTTSTSSLWREAWLWNPQAGS